MSYTKNIDTSLADKCDEPSDSLLADWITEQKNRFNRMLYQLELLSSATADNLNLDELGARLDDIDYHCSSLANIFDLIACDSLQDANDIIYNNICDDSCSESQLGLDTVEESKKLKRWPLLNALWFHVMMATDPDSIYYSPNIGKDTWLAYTYVPLSRG